MCRKWFEIRWNMRNCRDIRNLLNRVNRRVLHPLGAGCIKGLCSLRSGGGSEKVLKIDRPVGRRVLRFDGPRGRGLWYRPAGEEFYNFASRNRKPNNRAAPDGNAPLLVLRPTSPKGKHVTGFSGHFAPLRIQFLCHPGGGSLLSSQLLVSFSMSSISVN